MDIERRRGVRAIAGSFPRAGIHVIVNSPGGYAVTLQSGTKPEYGVGGFEVPVWTNGTFTLEFENESFFVVVEDNYIVCTFSETQQDLAEHRLVSLFMEPSLAQRWLDHFNADGTYAGLFALESRQGGRDGASGWRRFQTSTPLANWACHRP